jgi:hypothetical protein
MRESTRSLLREFRLSGGRFSETPGWLDFDVLEDLKIYRKLLTETAKNAWKLRHPTRIRLPSNFMQNTRLGISDVRPGSTSVRIEQIVLDDFHRTRPPAGAQSESLFDEAARIIDETLIAARDDDPFPILFFDSLLPVYEGWGSKLRRGESIILGPSDGIAPMYNGEVRQKLLSRTAQTTAAAVDLVGEVRAVRLNSRGGGTFGIVLSDNRTFSCTFTEYDETKILLSLHEHETSKVRITGVGRYGPSGELQKIVEVKGIEIMETRADRPPIWEVLGNIGWSIPPDMKENIPSDLAANLDNYLHGPPTDTTA